MKVKFFGYLWRLWLKLGTYRIDVIMFAVLVFLWYNLDVILLTMDPTAAVPSGEFLAKFLFAAFGLYFGLTVVKIGMVTYWNRLDKDLEQNFTSAYDDLTPWQKLRISLSVFFALLLVFALLVMAM